MKTIVQKNTTHSKNTTKPFVAPVPIIQKKLVIGASDDAYEVEADRIADKVVGMSDTQVQTKVQTGALVQRKCAACEQEEIQKKPLAESISPYIQKSSLKTSGEGTASNQITSQINSSKGAGNSMGNDTQKDMESRFGTDFSDVRIHTGSNAIQLSKNLNAQAFTVGNDIYFNEGKYNPASSSGKHLLAHELTHTLQQGESENKTIQRAVSEKDIQSNVQQYSTNCGWIDWPHASGENAGPILDLVRSASTGEHFTIDWPGHHHYAELNIEILQNLEQESEDIQNRVALGIFMRLSREFEYAQIDVEAFTLFIPRHFAYRSSYSIEDLPSNLIGFYRAMNGFSNEDICNLCGCWNKQSSLDRFNIDDESELLERWNTNFTPIELFRGGVWPQEFTTLSPINVGRYWRIVSSTGRGVVTSTMSQNEREVIMTIGNQHRIMPHPYIGTTIPHPEIGTSRERVYAAWVIFDNEAVLMVTIENTNVRELQFVMWVRTHLLNLAMQQIEQHQDGQIPTIMHLTVMNLPDQIPDTAVRR